MKDCRECSERQRERKKEEGRKVYLVIIFYGLHVENKHPYLLLKLLYTRSVFVSEFHLRKIPSLLCLGTIAHIDVSIRCIRCVLFTELTNIHSQTYFLFTIQQLLTLTMFTLYYFQWNTLWQRIPIAAPLIHLPNIPRNFIKQRRRRKKQSTFVCFFFVGKWRFCWNV